MIFAFVQKNGAKASYGRPRKPLYGEMRVERHRPRSFNLGARAVLRPAFGGHHTAVRTKEVPGFRESGAKLARGTGTMTGRDGSAVAGGPARHVPVLLRPAVDLLKVRDGGVYIDGTFGAGGYSRAILAAADTRVIGIDRDRCAVAQGAALVQAAGGRLTLIEERFSALDRIARRLGHESVDGVIFDVGVSSMQLEDPARGFSFRLEGPLDMRMGQAGPRAADVIARASERELANIIFRLGEERHARAVARRIVAARRRAPIETTTALAELVARVVRGRPGGIHPATRTFQALRMFVNEELAELVNALAAAERILKPSGRLVVVTFHSLEDRIVKTFFAERSRAAGVSRHRPDVAGPAPSFRLLTKRPIVPDEAEIAQNPRARSAKLRAGERTEAPPCALDIAALLPPLPALGDIVRGR
jgi:16S rRNA (cytosine1402-N4)-methyltransferase